ncbi:hypothetical protein BEP19_16750 [Ammoniphilus oxalaticus]|uniref:Uncharacterized protein n=1 Tax=Ammoniphilus oxalaticus TaxID=66863 RepID=A0A419SQ63_9BACL|nr:hypothetical protein [Ammoniphilus oxalaticus]RKD26487.1 hypothetical protein BEP19_16750 [Ammoniphilus oxalaticus]
MKKSTYFIIGTLFLIFSGLIYTIERINSIVFWSVHRIAASGGGSYPTDPTMPSLTENFFVMAFLIIGILFFLAGLLNVLKEMK